MAKLRIEVGTFVSELSFTNTKAQKVINRIFDSLAPKFNFTTDPPTPIVYTDQMKLDWFLGEVKSEIVNKAKALHLATRQAENNITSRGELVDYDL